MYVVWQSSVGLFRFNYSNLPIFIETLMMVMTLCLLVYNFAQYKQNFKEIIQEMAGIEGWNIRKDKELRNLVKDFMASYVLALILTALG